MRCFFLAQNVYNDLSYMQATRSWFHVSLDRNTQMYSVVYVAILYIYLINTYNVYIIYILDIIVNVNTCVQIHPTILSINAIHVCVCVHASLLYTLDCTILYVWYKLDLVRKVFRITLLVYCRDTLNVV